MNTNKSIAALKQMAKYLGLYTKEVRYDYDDSSSYFDSFNSTSSYYLNRPYQINMTFVVGQLPIFEQMSYENASSHSWKPIVSTHDDIDISVKCTNCEIKAAKNLHIDYMIFALEDMSCMDYKFKNLLK